MTAGQIFGGGVRRGGISHADEDVAACGNRSSQMLCGREEAGERGQGCAPRVLDPHVEDEQNHERDHARRGFRDPRGRTAQK